MIVTKLMREVNEAKKNNNKSSKLNLVADVKCLELGENTIQHLKQSAFSLHHIMQTRKIAYTTKKKDSGPAWMERTKHSTSDRKTGQIV